MQDFLSIRKQDMSLTVHLIEFKKTYRELNMLLPFSADIKVQQAYKENIWLLLSFLANFPSKFDTVESHILSSLKISSLQETFSRVLRTETPSSIQMSNALVCKNCSYESMKQQPKSNGSRVEPRGLSSGE